MMGLGDILDDAVKGMADAAQQQGGGLLGEDGLLHCPKCGGPRPVSYTHLRQKHARALYTFPQILAHSFRFRKLYRGSRSRIPA